MTYLSQKESELVALGAAMGSNCVPCVQFHIPEARKAGLTNDQIAEAIGKADKVRQVPARKVHDAAMQMLNEVPGGDAGADRKSCEDEAVPAGKVDSACCE